MSEERLEYIKKLFIENNGLLKSAQLKANKCSDRDIEELINKGLVKRVKNGHYGWMDMLSKLSDYEIASRVIPSGVISVLSAASHFELTTVNPTGICLTIPSSMLKPKLPDYPPIELFFIADKYLELGTQKAEIEGYKAKIYNKERTICDLFKYSNKIGRDVALEAFKKYMSTSDKNIQLLFEYATKLRVQKVIKPYVEALL